MAHAQRNELAFVVERELHLGHGIARLRIADEGFRTGRLPVYRPFGFLRRHHERDVLRVAGRLHAEGAADVFGDDAQFVVRDAHDGGSLDAHRVRALRTAMQRIAVACCVVDARGAAGFERGYDHALMVDAHFGDVGCILDDVGDGLLVVLARRRTGPIDTEIARRIGEELGLCLDRVIQLDNGR